MWSLLVWIGFLVGSWFVWDRWPEGQPHSGMWLMILILFLIATVIGRRSKA